MYFIYPILIGPILSVAGHLIIYFALTVLLTILWRAYTIIWKRRPQFLKPVSGKELVLITGATSGIGLAVAKHLWKIGYSIAVGYFDSNEIGFKQLKDLQQQSMRTKPEQRMLFLQLNVRKLDEIQKSYELIENFLTQNKMKLYALINNAGLGSLMPFAWLDRNDIIKMIETNLMGSLLMTREFLPLLVQARGRVVNVSSGLGLVPGATYATYGSTKAALVYFSRVLNKELQARYQVTSVAILPHNFIKNTNIVSQLDAKHQEAWALMKPNERRFYKAEYEEHSGRLKSLLDARERLLETAGKGGSSSSGGGERVASATQRDETGSAGRLMKVIRDFAMIATGNNTAESIETSGVVECFEDALRLRDPPEMLFAGDNIYNLVVGSLLLTLPTSCTKLLGSVVSPSLYK